MQVTNNMEEVLDLGMIEGPVDQGTTPSAPRTTLEGLEEAILAMIAHQGAAEIRMEHRQEAIRPHTIQTDPTTVKISLFEESESNLTYRRYI